jgi:hypothetical protein
MGGAFTGNIYVFYAVDLDSVLTIYRMLELCKTQNEDKKYNPENSKKKKK